MVGRSDELGRLQDALVQAAAGEPIAVMVSGEAGIGKTRLVAELVAGVPPGVRVLQGGCVPLAEGLLPYAPIAEILRGLRRDMSGNALLDLVGPDRDVLLGFFPDLGEPATGLTEADQYRLL